MKKTVSTRALFFIQLSVLVVSFLIDKYYLCQYLGLPRPSESFFVILFATFLSLLHLNFSIIFPTQIPFFEAFFYVIIWYGNYFVIGTEEVFGTSWANMYLLAFALLICSCHYVLAEHYPCRYKWKNHQEKRLFLSAIITVVIMMIICFFFPSFLIFAPKLLSILFIFYLF